MILDLGELCVRDGNGSLVMQKLCFYSCTKATLGALGTA